ncbi:MAG: histidinol-phosphate transaminase, partial [Bacteroidales bacterium]|nr:histidinol-phosphate transaminase [Bacteroidales bacterium]
YPTDANFILVKVDDANAVYSALLNSGIVTRNRNKVSLCAGCIRVTIGTPAENDALIAKLKTL